MTPSLEIVRVLLADHACADVGERDSLRRIHDIIATGTAPFSRAHYEPGHLTASGIVLNADRTHTLLIFHAKLQRWLQPPPRMSDLRIDATTVSSLKRNVRIDLGGFLKGYALDRAASRPERLVFRRGPAKMPA